MSEREPQTVDVVNGKIEAKINCDSCSASWVDWIDLGWRKQPPKVRPTVKGRCEVCMLIQATPIMREVYLAKHPEARKGYEERLERIAKEKAEKEKRLAGKS